MEVVAGLGPEVERGDGAGLVDGNDVREWKVARRCHRDDRRAAPGVWAGTAVPVATVGCGGMTTVGCGGMGTVGRGRLASGVVVGFSGAARFGRGRM